MQHLLRCPRCRPRTPRRVRVVDVAVAGVAEVARQALADEVEEAVLVVAASCQSTKCSAASSKDMNKSLDRQAEL